VTEPLRTRARRDDRGSAEHALVIVSTLTLVMLVMHASLFWYGQIVATRAAHQALDEARVLNGTEAAGEGMGGQLLDQTGVLVNPTVSVTRTDTDATATVQGEALSMLPGLTLTVTATASGPVERIEP
jgi:hypothetical protein